MKQTLLSFFVGSMILTSVAFAQEKKVSGRVTGADGKPLVGVTIAVQGSNLATQTDANGNYSFSVPTGKVIVFRSIGYSDKTLIVKEGQSSFNVTLDNNENALEEVIVTAQGIARTTKSLGYATQKVAGEELAQKSETNVLNALQGKVAGVNISSSSGQPGSSTNINIRGITSFGGSNQPLVVVDGIIFSNDTDNSQNTLFGSQPSNRLNDIPPDNIESINILKGPAASALYGSRASAGVIMITTKSGKGMGGKTEVTFSSSANWQRVAYLPELQTSYGQGSQNIYNNQSTLSWGPKFGSVPTVIQGGTGKEVPYQAYPNNIKDFFNTGTFYQNSLNLAGGDENQNFTAGVSSTIQKGVVPESKYNRHSLNLGGNSKLNNGIKLGGSITYSKTNQRGATMGNGGSAFGQLSRIPISYDLIGTPLFNEAGETQYFLPGQNSPLWSVENEFFTSDVDRVFGNLSIGYDITDWLDISYRVTGDTYFDKRSQVLRIGAARAPQGAIDEDNRFRSELNGDLMIRAKKSDLFTEGLSANVLLGQNINQRDYRESGIVSSDLSMFGYDNVKNASVFVGSYSNKERRRLLGYYAQLGLNYKEYLFLEMTGRVDKSSTLPKDNNTYFYPSAALSFVPTEAWGSLKSDVLSFMKIRANIAKVGRDADPYLLNTYYDVTTYGNNTSEVLFPLNGIPGFKIDSRIGNPNLKPEFVNSYEVGAQLGFFNNRIDLDFTYFSTKSSSQIFNVGVSNSSGFDTKTSNIGEMTNKGIEVMLNAYPVKNNNFSWNVNLNFTRIRNNVVSIFGDKPVGGEFLTSTVIPGINSFTGIAPSIAEGHPYGVIVGSKIPRNEKGELLINPNTGAFVPGVPNQILANPQKDYTLGISNTFRYKGVSVSAQFDINKGGQIFSMGQVDLRSAGAILETGVDRDQPRILPGVIKNADGTYRPNDIQVSAQTYWQGLGGIGSEAAVFDATSYRLRELAINYSLPKHVLKSSPFGQVSFGISGRNLWMFAPGFPSDPEVNTQGAGNVQGLDLNGIPTTKNFGFNIRATF